MILDRTLERRVLWRKVSVIIVIYFLLFVILYLIFPLILGEVWSSIMANGIIAFILSAFVREVLKIKLIEIFPETMLVYYLNLVKDFTIWRDLNVASYPEAEYVPNPALAEIEKDLNQRTLKQLLESDIYITGQPGAGKSTAIVRFMDLIRERLKKREWWTPFTAWIPSSRHPKLVILRRGYFSSQQVVKKFKEPVIFIIDDIHWYGPDEIANLNLFLTDLKSKVRRRVVICASRLRPPHPHVKLRGPTEVNCSESSHKDYADFLLKISRSASRAFGQESEVKITEKVLKRLINNTVRNHQPPLYIVALFNWIRRDLKRDYIVESDLDHLPKELREIYEDSWSRLEENQRCILRTIRLLKKIGEIETIYKVKGIFKCILKCESIDYVLDSFENSVWFNIDGIRVNAPEPPYDCFSFSSIDIRLEELVRFLIDSDVSDIEKCFHKGEVAASLLFSTGLHYGVIGKLSLSESCFSALRKRWHSFHPVASIGNLGVALSKQGKYEEAEEAFRRVLEIDSTDAKAWFLLGVVLSEQGKYEEEIQAYRRAIELDSTDAAAWYNLGVALSEQGKHEEAEEVYRRVLEIDSTDAKAWYNLGGALSRQGKHVEAEEAYRRAIELDSKYAKAWYNLGVVLGKQRKYEEAEEAFRRAIELDSTYAAAWYNLGVALSEQGKHEEAEKVYRRLLEIDSTDAAAWHSLGVVLGRQGKYEEEAQAYRRAIELDPTDAEAWYSLGHTLDKLGKVAEARDAFEQARSLGFVFPEKERF